MNKKYPEEDIESSLWNEGLIRLVSDKEVKIAVRAMKKKKCGRTRWYACRGEENSRGYRC